MRCSEWLGWDASERMAGLGCVGINGWAEIHQSVWLVWDMLVQSANLGWVGVNDYAVMYWDEWLK